MDIEIRHLKLITSIAEEGTLTHAASRLNLTQSALSHQLKEIEERLGVLLYSRRNRKLVMTEAGKRLLDSARPILERVAQAEEEIRGLAEGRTGLLRISTQCYTCYHWLPGVLQSFNKKHPGVQVQINIEATHRPVRALLEGNLDLAIVHNPEEKLDLARFPLFRDEMLALVHPGHRLASQPYLTPQDFKDETLFVYSLPTEEDDVYVLRHVLRPTGILPREIREVQLTEAMVEMVAAGLGLCVIARWAAAPYLKAGRVKALRVTPSGLKRHWIAMALPAENQPAFLLEFVRLLRNGTRSLTSRRQLL